MKTYTLEEVIDKFIGKVGTPERDRYDEKLRKELEEEHEEEIKPQHRTSPLG